MIDYIEQLKAGIEAGEQMEQHYYDMFNLYFARCRKLRNYLHAAEEKLSDDLKWTNFIHFCQTGRFLDEDKPGEWMEYL